ncbi:hypothetical protein SAMN06264365_14413 [Actinoplanes regularis]|uniref:Transcriptional regulator PadR-like family protein n=2 Tax=Actinoplanes regularis TaxID=52697 RepID=A0A239K891_9ACTN|nr:hypothetical protein Are01nite_89340 [Actinoplanes regularis]GLW35877.1 hypothetical protein Areg01_88120 [Actinoplanes regularis]SNT14221.1 hypothetical protein SAMN06264365_14413 [Actinoplanes regularis]
MTATLGDILLVFLADRSGTAHELQQRHAATFGPQRAVGVNRVVAALNRQEKLGHIHLLKGATQKSPQVCAPTEAGRLRQRAWILEVPPEPDLAEVLDRVLLAMAAADRATFEAVVERCLAALDASRPRRRARAVVSAPHALAEYDDVVAASLRKWLRGLAGRPRDRDAA